MVISISQSDYWELFDAAEPTQQQTHASLESFDMTWTYPQPLGQGYWREIQLRDGINLAIAHYQLQDAVTLHLPEREHPVEFSFHLAGGYRNQQRSNRVEQYFLYGSGLAPIETCEWTASEHIEVNVHIAPETFTAWLSQPSGLIPPELQHLIQQSPQEYYVCSDTTTVVMQTVLQQILHCPFQGITKRLYLESKVWELMALLVDRELQLQENPVTTRRTYSLKADDIERIHQARTILLQRFDHPPSLIELARQVGLNDCTLKRGFRQVFGQTAFGLLHDYRLERARQLLEEQRLNVSEIAQMIGFANRSYFAAAFRKKFGVTPRAYLSTCRNSA